MDALKDDRIEFVLDDNQKVNACGINVLFDIMSSFMTDAFVVYDFENESLKYISNNDLITYDYAWNNNENIDECIFSNLIYPDDIKFWNTVHNVIDSSLGNGDLLVDEIEYFAFVIRLKNIQFGCNETDFVMSYVKLKPILYKGYLKLGIYVFSVSVIRKQSNNLYVYYRNMDYSEYSFLTRCWEYFQFVPLTKRQKEMLMLAQQGLSLKETAVKMNVANKTIESMRFILFEKLGVNTIEQAIQYASNRRLIYCNPRT